MRNKISQYLEDRRVRTGPMASTLQGGMNGQFAVWHKNTELLIQVSDGLGWEHVSVSRRGKRGWPPSWDMMCFVKNLFWTPEECVIQYHPPESEYVNTHPGVLHLWRPINEHIPMPPIAMV